MDGRGNAYGGAPLVELERGGDAAAEYAAAAAVDPIPISRSRSIRAAVILLTWGAASFIVGAVPDLSIPTAHVMLSFAFLIAGVAMLTLAMAAPGSPAAATLETWITAII
uniref:Uncharacterized protein n=2 Tax=Oryza TaxID=4527 RepID=A0A0D3F153_9ORYZ